MTTWPMAGLWELALDGQTHRVELDFGDGRHAVERVSVDGQEMPIPGGRPGFVLQAIEQTYRLDLAGHSASLIVRYFRPRFAVRLRRAIRGGAQATLLWVTYDLVVDGSGQGTWIARVIGGDVEDWRIVEPGGVLPDTSADSWPEGSRSVHFAPHQVLTIDQLLAGGPWDRRYARAWSVGLEQTVRSVHEVLGSRFEAVPGRLAISYRVRRGSRVVTIAQLDAYDGRLSFPNGNLDADGGDLRFLQAHARETGMRAGGTWIELPEDETTRNELIQLVTRDVAVYRES